MIWALQRFVGLLFHSLKLVSNIAKLVYTRSGVFRDQRQSCENAEGSPTQCDNSVSVSVRLGLLLRLSGSSDGIRTLVSIINLVLQYYFQDTAKLLRAQSLSVAW